MKVSAGIAIYYNKKILLIHPTKTPMFGTWSVPKGEIEEGESPLEAALRETKEEVGIEIDSKTILNNPRIFNYTNKAGYTFKRVYLFTLEISSLDSIGLESEMIFANSLQRKEVDMAMFFDKRHAKDYLFWRYRPLLDKI